MRLEGEITWVGEVVTGTSQRGAWQKQEFVLCYERGQYPNDILLTTMDEKYVGKLAAKQMVSVDFDFRVREYTGRDGVARKVNDTRVWRDGIRFLQPAQQQYAQPAPPQQYQQQYAPQQFQQPAPQYQQPAPTAAPQQPQYQQPNMPF